MYYLLSRSPHIAVVNNLPAPMIMRCAIAVSICLKQFILVLFSNFHKKTKHFSSNHTNYYLENLFLNSSENWRLLTAFTFSYQHRHYRLHLFQEKLFADMSIFRSKYLILKHSWIVSLLYSYQCIIVQKFVSIYSDGIFSQYVAGT
jgi:hypothetical protein